MGLGIREARRAFSELVKRVAYGGEEIRIGSRGREEATLIGTHDLERLRRELRQARLRLRAIEGEARGGGERPFAGLQAALEAGEIRVTPDVRQRRVIPNLRSTSGLTRERQSRLGGRDTREPRFRRGGPRA